MQATTTNRPVVTAALVLTAATSLGLIVASFAVADGPDAASAFRRQFGIDDRSLVQWANGVSLIVFFRPDATAEQIDPIRERVGAATGVRWFTYLDQHLTYLEFGQIYADKPEVVARVKPEELPRSLRVALADPSADASSAFGGPYERLAGVSEVRYRTALIDDALSYEPPQSPWLERDADWVMRGFAVALLAPAVLMALALRRDGGRDDVSSDATGEVM
ncbi:MAG TPA: permease-like cell division protein FtsX [Acidimicrobiales bacterium]|jgi:hypothetical protein|nr:permease-like cell division protein FtsX [Acidimicrobiales bacterium]